jgi:hypothetical protein
MAKEWTPVEVETQILSVEEAFKTWNEIRDEATGVPGVSSRHEGTPVQRAKTAQIGNGQEKETS